MNVIKRFFARFRRQHAATPVPTPPAPLDHLDLMRHTYRAPEHSAVQRKRTTHVASAKSASATPSRRSEDDCPVFVVPPSSYVPFIADDPAPATDVCSRASYDAPTGGGGSFSGAGASGDWSSSSSSSYDSGSSSSDSSSSSSYD